MTNISLSQTTIDKIASFCKRVGIAYQSSEIYGGINGVYDIGPLGTLIKQNLRKEWLKALQSNGLDILPFEGSILAPESVWNASGHTENFQDPLVDCLICKHRFRADDIDMTANCTNCGNRSWTDVRQFNLMFKTHVGASVDKSSIAYLRPETAQSIFINFKNIMSTNRVKIPFGVAQIGKAFRNEITPKQFLFRMREFEQMEIEWFCKGDDAKKYFDFWCAERINFYKNIGIDTTKIRLRAHAQDELSHYSSYTSDVEYQFPFGWKELEGIAYRGNFDLTQHSKFSGKDLSVYEEETKESYIPHVVECSIGTDRLLLTVLFDAYQEEQIEDETRVVLKLHSSIAPYKAAFLPLSKQLIEPAEKIYSEFKKKFSIQFDTTGSIGKRYRRQDEIGTPLCFTYDFESLEDHCVTVRDRDSMKQKRIAINDIEGYLINPEKIKNEL